MYVLDDLNRIQKFDSNGNFIRSWSCEDNEGQQNLQPKNIAVGADGSIYASVYVVQECAGETCTYDFHIQKFDGDGNFITKWGSSCSIDSDWDGVPDQPCDGQFYFPSGIAIGSEDSVYLVDKGNYRVQKFDSSGNFIKKWGNRGSSNGEFEWPEDVAIGTDGFVYVVDKDNRRIQKFDSNGNFITKWGSGGD